ncbi:MAG: hypothetical protein WCO86_18605 [Planctomycetota bacterium]
MKAKQAWQIFAAAVALGLGVWMLGAAWRLIHREESPAITPKVEVRVTDFFDAQIQPLVKEETLANSRAVAHAKMRLHEVFDKYRSHAPHFSDKLTHWGVKWDLMKASLHDWWNKDNDAAQLTRKLFSESIFSEAELKRDLESVMKEFSSELEANRNLMLVQTIASLRSVDVPMKGLSVDGLTQAFQAQVEVLLRERAKDVPQVTLLAAGGGLSAGIVFGWMAEALTDIVVSWAATAAVTAGGSTVVAGTAGGAGGTTVGPAGTVAGVVAGLIVGGAADWWMESHFKEKMTMQTVEALDGMEAAVWKDKKRGLNILLAQLIEENRIAHEKALKNIAANAAHEKS